MTCNKVNASPLDLNYTAILSASFNLHVYALMYSEQEIPPPAEGTSLWYISGRRLSS